MLLSDVSRVLLGEGAIANYQVGTTDTGLEEDCYSYARLELLARSSGDRLGYVKREPNRELQIAKMHIILDTYDLGINLSRISTSYTRITKEEY